MDACIYLPV
jgi:hypothetical protein